uniref:Uncharacterized protein n=1 Tax=viral metagenome TaxID=1070528 RepID=A0A6C0EFX4_9ZZZZ
MGRIQGIILSSKEPGKNPIFSSTLTDGRVNIILLYLPEIKFLIPCSTENNVLPVPAGPDAKMIL